MKSLSKLVALLMLSVWGLQAQTKESLLIGPGDMLHVQVFDTPELEQHARVTDAGELPLIMGGNVRIVGKTPAQAADAIQNVLLNGHFLLHPRVLITVEEYATEKVSIIGEVRAPGAYNIGTPRSILDVLTMAGGLTDLADRKVLIERKGTQERVPYFVSNKADVALDSAVRVNPGDSIVVPKAGIVYVLGDVAHPGGYTMTNNDAQLSVLQLVARAGGTNHSAVPSHAKLIHKQGDTYAEEPLPLSAMQKGNHADMPLRADDVIWIPFSYIRNFGAQGSGIVSSIGSAAVYRF
jgi:polysaccharide biosynthesis/export protein